MADEELPDYLAALCQTVERRKAGPEAAEPEEEVS
jgi:hypothetical protein